MDKREFFEFLRDEIIEAMPELENAQFFTREVKKDNNRVYNALNIKDRSFQSVHHTTLIHYTMNMRERGTCTQS